MNIALTETQKMMIKKLEEAKAETEARAEVLRAKHPNLTPDEFKELGELQNKLININNQIRKAKQPVVMTPEKEAAIDKLIKNIEANAEITQVEAPEVSSAEEMSSKDEFQYSLNSYVEEMKASIPDMEKQLAVQKLILENMENFHPFEDKYDISLYNADIETRRNIVEQLETTIQVVKKRIELAQQNLVGWAMDNYEMLSKFNFFVNNSLKLKDYEDYIKECVENK